MPQILEYTPQSPVPGAVQTGREARGQDFGSQVGEGEQAIGQGLENVSMGMYAVERRKEQDDISGIHAKASIYKAQKMNELQDILSNAEPQDRASVEGTVQQFMDGFKDGYAKIGDQATTKKGRQFYTQKEASDEAEFMELAHRGMAQKAGEYSVLSEQQAIEAKSNFVYNNPSSLEKEIDDQDFAVGQKVSSGLLDRINGDKLNEKARSTLSQAAFQGWLNLSPDEAQKQLDSGKWDKYFSGDEKKQAQFQVNRAFEAQRIEAERQRREQERLKKEQDDVTNQGFLKDFSDHNLNVKTVLNSDLPFHEQEHWFNALKHQDEKTNDEPIRSEILRRIYLPEGDPQKITAANQIAQFVPQGLKTSSLPAMNNLLTGKGTLEYEQQQADMKGVRDKYFQLIAKPDPVTKQPDPASADTWYKAEHAIQDAFSQGKKEGRSNRELFDPSSSHYIGKAADPYRSGLVDRLNRTMNMFQNMDWSKLGTGGGAGTESEPRKPGETPEQYLQRTKGGK